MDWTFQSWLGHSLSVGAIVGVFLGMLPSLAAGASFIWFCFQIYETKSVQTWLRNRRRRRIHHLREQVKELQDELDEVKD